MKSSRLNPLLLVFSLLCLMFGLYGFLFGGRLATPPAANAVSAADFTETRAEQDAQQPTKPAARQAAPETTTDHKPSPQPVPEVPAPELDAPRVAGQGVITGVVMDPDGTPVEGAAVVAIDLELLETTSFDLSAPPAELRAILRDIDELTRGEGSRATTDAQGRFQIKGLDERGSFQLVARSGAFGRATKWEVRPGADVRLEFTATALLRVRVLDPDGNPLQRANVRREGEGSSSWGVERGVDGLYSVEWGHWVKWVSFTARGYQASRHFTDEDLETPDLEVRLQRACCLSGTISDLSGNPIPNATVQLLAFTDLQGTEVDIDSFTWEPYENTDSGGRYYFDSLQPGRYLVKASITDEGALQPATREIEVSADSSLDFSLDAGAHATIEVLGENDAPVNRFTVGFRDTNGNYIDGMDLPRGKPGVSEFIGLPRESLLVTVSAGEYCPQRLQLDLASGEGRLLFKLGKGARVSGSVMDTAGHLVSGVRLRWTPAGKDPGEAADQWVYASDGTFETGPHAPGSWIIDVYLEAYLAEKITSQTVQLAAGECRLDLVVDSPRVLKIQVELDDGVAAEWVEVRLQRQDEADWQSYDISEINSERKLFLPGLPPGEYRLYAHADRHSSSIANVQVGDRPIEVTLKLKKPDCVRITRVESGSNADLRGMKEGDLLFEYDFQPVTSLQDLVRFTKLADGRQDVSAVVFRNGERIELRVNGGLLGVAAEGACK